MKIIFNFIVVMVFCMLGYEPSDTWDCDDHCIVEYICIVDISR